MDVGRFRLGRRELRGAARSRPSSIEGAHNVAVSEQGLDGTNVGAGVERRDDVAMGHDVGEMNGAASVLEADEMGMLMLRARL